MLQGLLRHHLSILSDGRGGDHHVCKHAAGIVEASSRRMGNRSKSLLKKGQSLGERAILEGEPAGETCSAGSPVLALIVNRQAPHEAHVHCCNDRCHTLQQQARPSQASASLY